jgi:hypothetical protein
MIKIRKETPVFGLSFRSTSDLGVLFQDLNSIYNRFFHIFQFDLLDSSGFQSAAMIPKEDLEESQVDAAVFREGTVICKFYVSPAMTKKEYTTRQFHKKIGTIFSQKDNVEKQRLAWESQPRLGSSQMDLASKVVSKFIQKQRDTNNGDIDFIEENTDNIVLKGPTEPALLGMEENEFVSLDTELGIVIQPLEPGATSILLEITEGSFQTDAFMAVCQGNGHLSLSENAARLTTLSPEGEYGYSCTLRLRRPMMNNQPTIRIEMTIETTTAKSIVYTPFEESSDELLFVSGGNVFTTADYPRWTMEPTSRTMHVIIQGKLPPEQRIYMSDMQLGS